MNPINNYTRQADEELRIQANGDIDSVRERFAATEIDGERETYYAYLDECEDFPAHEVMSFDEWRESHQGKASMKTASENDNAIAAFEERVNNDDEVKTDEPHEIKADNTLNALLGGNATVTLKSKKTGDRRTFKIAAKKGEDDFFFVRLLTGPNNEDWGDYDYLGIIVRDNSTGLLELKLTGKSCVSDRSNKSYLALAWTLHQLQTNPANVAENVEVWHEGRCCRCNRPLTVPESIETGFGPICLAKMG